MLRWLQNFPHFLEMAYDFTGICLRPFKDWLKPGSRSAKLATSLERAGKRAVFNCKMCGQCILHSTGMTCPLNCPKHLRNGPCGGVRPDGNCEVHAAQPCVWVLAYQRSLNMPKYGHEFVRLQPPMNNQLKNSSSWINLLYELDSDLPPGWMSVEDISITQNQEAGDGHR